MPKTSVLFTGAQTGGTILDPTSGKRWVLTKLIVTVTGTAIVSVFDGTDAAASQVFKQRITDGIALDFEPDRGEEAPRFLREGFLRSSAADNILKITYPETVNAYVTIHYYEE